MPFGRGKLTQFVEYPTSLDITGAMSDANPKARGVEKYSLTPCSSTPGGSMHSGHYYCYVKAATGVWYEMDDEGVSATSERTALNQKAYLLFYAREGTGLDGKGTANAALAAAKRRPSPRRRAGEGRARGRPRGSAGAGRERREEEEERRRRRGAANIGRGRLERRFVPSRRRRFR